MQTINDFTPEKYINKILTLYPMGEREETKLNAGLNMIAETFGKYSWANIESAIEWYYKNKNDKTRPTIAQMKDVLITLGIADVDGVVAKPDNPFARPTTNIWSIRGDFDKMVDVFIECGVIPDEDGTYHGEKTIIDPATDLPVLNPMFWFGYHLTDIENNNPDLFTRFEQANKLERLAIALGNKMIPFKVRDWKKLAASIRAQNGGVIPREQMGVVA